MDIFKGRMPFGKTKNTKEKREENGMPGNFSGVKDATELEERIAQISISEEFEGLNPYKILMCYNKKWSTDKIWGTSMAMQKLEEQVIERNWTFENFFGVPEFSDSQEKKRYCQERKIGPEELDGLIKEWQIVYGERGDLAELRHQLRTANLPFEKATRLWELEAKYGTNPYQTKVKINELLNNQIEAMYNRNLETIKTNEKRPPEVYAPTDIKTNNKMKEAAIRKAKELYSPEMLYKGIDFKYAATDTERQEHGNKGDEDQERGKITFEDLEQKRNNELFLRLRLEDLRYLLRANALKKINIIEEKHEGGYTFVEKVEARLDQHELYRLEKSFGLKSEDPIQSYLLKRFDEINSPFNKYLEEKHQEKDSRADAQNKLEQPRKSKIREDKEH